MNRGYAGFYKGFYLRSSYEYAYAVYLDFHSIQWSYEDQVFDLGNKQYKPDFFFYNQDGIIEKVVEVKSRNKEAQKNAAKDLTDLESLYNIKGELISYEELLLLYKNLPFSLNSIITSWINSKETTINKANCGKLNGHYNLRHSSDTKKKIGENTKRLWLTNSNSKKRMLEGLRNSGLAQRGKIKTPRESRICPECNEPFKVLITSSRTYCGRGCSGRHAIELATLAYLRNRNQVHEDIKKYVINWSIINRSIVLQTPLNKISTTIYPLINDIHSMYGVKDFRVISKAVFGKDCGRKELLLFMKKSVMKRYAELMENQLLELKDKKPLG